MMMMMMLKTICSPWAFWPWSGEKMEEKEKEKEERERGGEEAGKGQRAAKRGRRGKGRKQAARISDSRQSSY